MQSAVELKKSTKNRLHCTKIWWMLDVGR